MSSFCVLCSRRLDCYNLHIGIRNIPPAISVWKIACILYVVMKVTLNSSVTLKYVVVKISIVSFIKIVYGYGIYVCYFSFFVFIGNFLLFANIYIDLRILVLFFSVEFSCFRFFASLSEAVIVDVSIQCDCLASFPGLRGGEGKAWYALFAHAR